MFQGITTLSKDYGPTTEPGKAVGIKWQTDTPSSPGLHNVYVRRKVESGHSKAKEQQPHQDVQHEPVVAESLELVSSKSPEKPNGEIVPDKTEPLVATGTGIGIHEDVKQLSIQILEREIQLIADIFGEL
ncbi:unnamed protein product [Urochloa humidicola]